MDNKKRTVKIGISNINNFDMFNSGMLKEVKTTRMSPDIESQADESCGPVSIINKAAELKTRIKLLESEYREIEDLLIGAININGGEVTCGLGRFTLCKKNEHKFSDDVLKLESQVANIKTKIKAKKMVEIASGAEVIKSEYTVRFNPIIPGINDEE